MNLLRSSEIAVWSRTAKDNAPVVYVVDDDVSVCESLEMLLLSAGHRPVSFLSAGEFLAYRRPSAPHCLILDLTLPDMSGLELQARIAPDHRDWAPIIFITGYGDVPTSVCAMKAGAIEFLTKPLSNEVVLDAVRFALEKSQEAFAAHLEMRELLGRYNSLSRREREVMHLVVRGLLNKQVGAELGITAITVKAHRGRMMRKMQADSFAALVTMAAKLKV
jgi:FixJ family two-component response regulator